MLKFFKLSKNYTTNQKLNFKYLFQLKPNRKNLNQDLKRLVTPFVGGLGLSRST